MKKYKVIVLLQSGTSNMSFEKIHDNIKDFTYSSAGCYILTDIDEKRSYYPIINTVITEL